MAQRKGLGRGLDALLGGYSTPGAGVRQIEIRLIDNNPNQPRREFDKERLQELADSIKRHGVVQPIILVENGSRFTIVAGERRYRAARLAGLEAVPAIVNEFAEEQIYEIALIENIQRENLNPIEEAMAIRFLMQQHDLTQEEVSARLGKSRSSIANAVRLLNLPDPIMDFVKDGRLQTGHAKVLLGVKDDKRRELLANQSVASDWSVRELEARVAAKPKQAGAKQIRRQEPMLSVLEERMRRALGTKVNILGDEKKGKLVIDYYSMDGLETLYAILCGEIDE